jgi:YHS domain-containing protein
MPLTRRTLLIASAASLATVYGIQSVIADTGDLGGLIYKTSDGVAIDGTDTVAYFTQGKPVAGSAEFTHDWQGATWQFASAENRDLFAADPTAYAPQYGGYCAWAVGEKNSLASTEPERWAIVDDKLYLNFNRGVQRRWDKDRAGFITQGDINWPDLVAGNS